MVEIVKPFAETCAAIVEILGILVIVVPSIYTLILGAIRLLQKTKVEVVFRQLRQHLGRALLLGLEFLVAADIIHTVAVEFSLKTVGVLAIIVIIRTFLSFTLEVELTGRWPWNQQK